MHAIEFNPLAMILVAGLAIYAIELDVGGASLRGWLSERIQLNPLPVAFVARLPIHAVEFDVGSTGTRVLLSY